MNSVFQLHSRLRNYNKKISNWINFIGNDKYFKSKLLKAAGERRCLNVRSNERNYSLHARPIERILKSPGYTRGDE